MRSRAIRGHRADRAQVLPPLFPAEPQIVWIMARLREHERPGANVPTAQARRGGATVVSHAGSQIDLDLHNIGGETPFESGILPLYQRTPKKKST